jgi:FkbM family methyltransferase
MIARLAARAAGKFQAASAFFEMVRYLRNWPEIWRAYRKGQALPSPLLLRNGLRVEFGREDDVIQVFREVFVHHCYTPTWFHVPKSGDVVVDLGANIGVFSLAMAHDGARCHAFEPVAGTRGRLLRNVEANGLSKSIVVQPFGVAGRTERVAIKMGTSSIHTSLHSSGQVDERAGEMIDVLPLADALARTGEPRIDLVKVDIEGAEQEMFENAPPDVLTPVRKVVMEFHGHIRPGARAAAEKALTAAGLLIVRVDATDATGSSGILYAQRP